VGLIAIVVPMWLARRANLPGPTSAGWMRLWGAMLLITASLYLPGFSNRSTYVGRTLSVSSGAFSWRSPISISARAFGGLQHTNWYSRSRWHGATAVCCARNSCPTLSVGLSRGVFPTRPCPARHDGADNDRQAQLARA